MRKLLIGALGAFALLLAVPATTSTPANAGFGIYVNPGWGYYGGYGYRPWWGGYGGYGYRPYGYYHRPYGWYGHRRYGNRRWR